MSTNLPPIPLGDIRDFPFTFQEWLRKINQILSSSGIAWSLIDFTGSDLDDIETKNHNDLDNIQGGSAAEYYHLTSAQNTQVVNFVETAQDAVGAMVDSTLVYVDATPLLTRAALTGDITAPQASNATTLATVNGNVGTFGSASQVPQITVNAKGLITAASNITISTGDVVGPASATDTAVALFNGTTGKLIKNSTVTVDTSGNIVTNGALVAQGGSAPTVGTSLTKDWVTAGVPFNTLINAGNSANARMVNSRYDAGGVWSLQYTNDAFGASVTAMSVTGTSSAIGAVVINGTTLALSGAITAALGAKFTGGSQPGVTVSANNLVVVGGFPYQQMIDAAQSANNRMVDTVFAAGVLYYRFVNDAYGASTAWLKITGGHGTGITSQSFEFAPTLFGLSAVNANGGFAQTKAGTQTTNNANIGGTVYVNTTQTGNTALTETNAFSHSIAANTLTVNGSSIEFYAAGTFATSASVDKRVKVVYGGTTLFDSGALAVTVAADWNIRGAVIRTGAATQKATVTFECSDAALRASTDYTTPAETLSGAVTMKLTVNGTNANDTVAELYKESWAAAA